jgi:hypothetical protein
MITSKPANECRRGLSCFNLPARLPASAPEFSSFEGCIRAGAVLKEAVEHTRADSAQGGSVCGREPVLDAESIIDAEVAVAPIL